MVDYPRLQEDTASFRPHAQAIILGQLKSILTDIDPDAEEIAPIFCEPLTHLDAAQRVLIQWGVTVPWCWIAWNDERIVDYDVVQLLVRSYITACVHLTLLTAL